MPDECVTATVDASGIDQEGRAILAHRSEGSRERPLPGILSRLPAQVPTSISATKY